MRRLFLPIIAALVLVGGLAACSSSSKTASSRRPPPFASRRRPSASSTASGNPAVVIGSANFPENEILADIYADVLKGQRGPGHDQARHRQPRGLLQRDGERDPERVPGVQRGPARLPPTVRHCIHHPAVDAALAQALPSSLEALQSSSAQDKDSVTVTSSFAKAHNLSSISDLKALGTITFGGPPEWKTREQGLIGLEKVYGLSINFKPLDESGPLTIAALNGGTVQAGDIFTTDPSVTKYHFVALADPKHLFSAAERDPDHQQVGRHPDDHERPERGLGGPHHVGSGSAGRRRRQ